jgi:energy-coupling factor transport system substrate-specific component
MMSRLKQDFTTITWVMIPVAIAINIAIGTLIYAVKFPFVYLDMIGTVLVGVLCGPWAGLLTGVLSKGDIRPNQFILHIHCWGVIGFLAGWFSQWGWFRSVEIDRGGAITGCRSSSFGSHHSLSVWRVTGPGLMFSLRFPGFRICEFMQILSGLAVDPLDKQFISIVFLIVRLLPSKFVAIHGEVSGRPGFIIWRQPIKPAPGFRWLSSDLTI